MVVDANAPREGASGAVQDDTALSGISSVVVKGTLAFVTAPGVQRVVSVDLAADASPRILSFEKLSGAVPCPSRRTTASPSSGYAHGGASRSCPTYSGVMMKVGSIKDGRLGGELRDVRASPRIHNAFAVTDAAGGSVLVVNATTRAPLARRGLQAQGRAAAAAPLSPRTGTSTPPPAGPQRPRVARATALAMGGTGWRAGQRGRGKAVVALDATDREEPILALCRLRHQAPRGRRPVRAGRAAAAGAAPSRPCPPPRRAPGAGGGVANRRPAVLYAVVPGANRLLVLRDAVGPRSCPTTSCERAGAKSRGREATAARACIAAPFYILHTKVSFIVYYRSSSPSCCAEAICRLYES